MNTVGRNSAEKARTVALSPGRDLVEAVERFVVAQARQAQQSRIHEIGRAHTCVSMDGTKHDLKEVVILRKVKGNAGRAGEATGT